ncbi:MAG: DNA translocase FtsK 4TM domain-containing protein [Patescibacteria group bacterium]
MPRHKRRQTGPRFWQRKKDRGKGYQFDFGMKEETRRETVAIVSLVLFLIYMLAIFGYAGHFGNFVLTQTRILIGLLAYLLPFIFLTVVASIVNPKMFEIRLSTVVGIILFFFSFGGLLQMLLNNDNPVSLAYSGSGGGLAGYFSVYILSSVVGSIATFLILFAVMLLSVSMSLNTSILKLFASFFNNEEDDRRITVNEGGNKVSVFTTVKKGFSGFRFGKNKDLPSKAPVLEVKPIGMPKSGGDGVWSPPPMDLLEIPENNKANPGNIQKNVEVIEKTLREFSIDVTMQDVNIGPTVTQYTFKPTEGVKLANITARSNDLALALAAKSLRMEAPIPGQSAVGVEIPNKQTARVTLRELLESKEYQSSKGKLTIPLGRDVAGTPMVIDLEKMPHLLIAGATGSGKSVAINSIIISYIMNNAPADLRLLLVDPKRVELTGYNGIPHLSTPVITEPEKTVNALKWAVSEMENRYRLFADLGARNLAAYNEKPGPLGKLPHIVIIIDELADLMAVSANDVESSIVRLAQMARAIGIHLIVATQRPSVDVITGLIKANIPSRIAFTVASQVDSRTILDVGGAEKLLGLGDMLYIGGDITKPKRIQGCFVSDKEINSITNFLKKDQFVQYDESITEYHSTGASVAGSGNGVSEDDLYNDAVSVVVQAGKASASLLQRRMRIGYARAARLLDLLEAEGVIGPPDGARPRDVLVSPTELHTEDR